MGTAELIQLIDKLVKAKIPKPTATELVDRIDKGNDGSLYWLKWIVGIGFPILIAIVTYLHSDTKKEILSIRQEVQTIRQEVQTVRQEVQIVRQEVQIVRQDLKDIHNKIDRLLISKR